MILFCFRCRDNEGLGAQYQNKKYGYGMRVHNQTETRQGFKFLHRCMVCGQERTKSGESRTSTPAMFLTAKRPLGR